MFSVALGNFLPGPDPFGNSSIFQAFDIPAGGGTLSFWHWDFTTDNITNDWQDVRIIDGMLNILQIIFHQAENGQH